MEQFDWEDIKTTVDSGVQKLRKTVYDCQLAQKKNRETIQRMLRQERTVQIVNNIRPETAKTFEAIQVLKHLKKPIFSVYEDRCHRVVVYQPILPLITQEANVIENLGVIDQKTCKRKTFVQRLCKCCGELVKKHTCQHTQCIKPCSDFERQKKIKLSRLADGKSVSKVPVSQNSKSHSNEQKELRKKESELPVVKQAAVGQEPTPILKEPSQDDEF